MFLYVESPSTERRCSPPTSVDDADEGRKCNHVTAAVNTARRTSAGGAVQRPLSDRGDGGDATEPERKRGGHCRPAQHAVSTTGRASSDTVSCLSVSTVSGSRDALKYRLEERVLPSAE